MLRESACLNYEKPFLYLLFGSQKCFLIDTGCADGIGKRVRHRSLVQLGVQFFDMQRYASINLRRSAA